jgi:hypothetical protein
MKVERKKRWMEKRNKIRKNKLRKQIRYCRKIGRRKYEKI